MKSTATFKRLLFSGLLLVAGASVASAQDYGASAPELTRQPGSYRITFPETLAGVDVRSGITVGSTTELISIGDIQHEGSTFTVEVTIPEGTPVGTVVSLVGAGKPLWHVTVADILGNSQSDDEVVLRPLDEPTGPTGTGTGAGNNPNAISQPASSNTSTPTVSGSVSNAKPEFHVYPNPTVEFITIVTEGEVLWGVAEVIDPTGKRVLEIPTGVQSGAGISQFTVNVSSLRSGMYFLRMRAGNDVVTKRFFVSK